MFSKASISQVLLSRLELHDGAGTGGGISEESKRAMTPTVWRPYPDRVRSSHWYELFADTQGEEVYGQRRYTPAETFGVVVVSGRTGRSVSLRATKAGYYGSAEEIGYAGLGLGVKDGYVMSWSDESTTETRDFAVRAMLRCRG